MNRPPLKPDEYDHITPSHSELLNNKCSMDGRFLKHLLRKTVAHKHHLLKYRAALNVAYYSYSSSAFRSLKTIFASINKLTPPPPNVLSASN